MPRTKKLTEQQQEWADYAIRELFPHLSYLTTDGPDEVYERAYENDTWRVRSHWFPENPDHPDPTMRPTMLEVSVVLTDHRRGGKKFHAWFYRPGTGNDVHPEYNGWRVHAWVG